MKDVVVAVRRTSTDADYVGELIDKRLVPFSPNAFLGIGVNRSNIFLQFPWQNPGLTAKSLCDKHTSFSNLDELLFSLLENFAVGSGIPLLALILQIHPVGIPEVFRRVSVLINNPKRPEKIPHAIVNAKAKLVSKPDMIMKSRS